jgi:predicted enzyme related to lactoylglutathione lyase
MKRNPVVHFEMPAKDKKRVSEFYSKVFGWNMVQLGEEMGNYILASTTDTDEKTQTPKEPGSINGGFFDWADNDLDRVPHLVISVENLEKSIEDVKAAGGITISPKMDIPGVGKYVSFKDTEGNVVGMLQAPPMA